MSLFIGSLAFTTSDYDAQIRLGVLAGSLLSAAVGYALLLLAFRTGDQARGVAETTAG